MSSTATKPKKSATEAMAHTRDDGDTILQQAEEILFEVSDERHKFDPGKMVVLRLAGIDIDDPHTLAREVGRVLNVKGAMAAAGTAAEFQQAQDTLATAKADEEAKRPALEEVRRQADADLAALEGATRSAQAVVDSQQSARRRLRDEALLPRFQVYRHGKATADVQRAVRPRIGELEDQLRRTSYVEKLDPKSAEAIAHCELQLADLLDVTVIQQQLPPDVQRNGERGWRQVKVNEALWGEYVSSLVNARPAAEKELAELRATLASGIADCEILLEYYVDRL
jgi:hypothetical protein